MNVVDGNLLILASAGSGKTYQLGNRVIGRVARGVEPAKIVALTFTRKAAGEFADSVLGKLAEAVLDANVASRLAADLGDDGIDFDEILQGITRDLPRFTLTTIDSFFTRVVRGFQYDLGLTGGRFDLLEGARAASARDELLGELLGRALDDGRASGFANAFRRATAGREGVSIAEGLRGFIEVWHRRFSAGKPCIWGPDFLTEARTFDWENKKHALADAARHAIGAIEETYKRQVEAVAKFIDAVEAYELAGGAFPDSSAVAKGILDALASDAVGDVELKFHKTFILPAPALRAIGDLVGLAAASEMAAAVERTRAIAGVIEGYDDLVATRLRRRGLLGFDDVKRLMGAWCRSEDARVRRELVDFRLGARYEHWLLDEFQDTSREEWEGLLPLLQEAVSGDDGSLFIVGDRKQAIYGWRGGDVSLFDEVQRVFGAGIRSIPMAESWRSCPEVLELVNRVCGNESLIRGMFGIGPERWHWDTHVSAPPLQNPERAGEVRVEVVDPDGEESGESIEGDADETASATDDPRILAMITRMRELGVGEKELTCGVLVRRNEDGRVVADALRAAGFDVVLDGIREPAGDHPACVAVWQLLRWLANPRDDYARRVVEMSPLAGALRHDAGEPWYQIWERVLAACHAEGFAKTLEQIVEPLLPIVSAYGKRRLAEIIDALAAFDAAPDAGAAAAARWIERLEVPQNPGAAAVQVMTIHKSKGLGFDVVFIPFVPDRRIPESQRFQIAEGDGWITSVPPAWARALFPALRAAEQSWVDAARYEALCQLYVALTRAKRGLYIYLAARKPSADPDAPTLANWMLKALDAAGNSGVIYQNGDPSWSTSLPMRTDRAIQDSGRTLGPAVSRRRRTRPSAHDEATSAGVPGHAATPVSWNPAGMAFGSEVHACFECVGWLEDFDPATLPGTDAGRLVAATLGISEIAHLFRKPASHDPVLLLREQPVDAILGDRWVTGIIDRMHVHRDPVSGRVVCVEIIDFKTDAVTDADELVRRHAPQMRAYATVVAMLYPGAEVGLFVVSTALGRVIRIDED
jgi:ATP-dependent exoDNAse (exonuclease V) beta subunit